ncbi:MAG: GGDEF domain-containing protein [Nitrospinota bacterium]|nr:MAG: GGDEF domain-containing protein [Nitrospinota bacterium]
MKLFTKRRQTVPEPSPEELAQQLAYRTEQVHFYLHALRVFGYFIKEFSFDLLEIGADRFQKQIDQLITSLTAEKPVRSLKRVLEQGKARILEYVQQEKAYFQEREAEFKHIIELLTTGIASLTEENKVFHARLYQRSSQLEKITYLNDIRKIKEELRQEIMEIKRCIRQKQSQDAQRMEALSRQMESLKIDFEQAKKASLTDGLTGVYNRAAFDQYMAKLVEQSSISRRSFTLILLDIDDFKRINDTYGHRVGDRVLIALVQQCRAFIRKDDFMARYGGEEFAIILPDTSLRTALRKARKICKTIAATRYTVDELAEEIQKLSFTVSMGVGIWRDGDTVASLIDRTDKALYQAKRAGKNRVVSERELPS